MTQTIGLQITFGPWSLAAYQALVAYAVSDPLGVGIASVTVSIYRDDQAPMPHAGAIAASTSVDVHQFTGNVHLVVTATDSTGVATTRSTLFAVDTFITPTAPDWIAFRNESANGITFDWGSANTAVSNGLWRIVNVDALGVATTIAEVPVGLRTIDIVAPTGKLKTVNIYGVDLFGHASIASPTLRFVRERGGPVINLGSWSTTVASVTIPWSISSNTFIRDVTWTIADGIHQYTGEGTPLGSATVPMANFQGLVTLTLSATDDQNRQSISQSQFLVYNVLPLAPTLQLVETGMTYVKLLVTPAHGDPVVVASVDLFGSGLSVNLPAAPFIYTVSHLDPATTYSFSARSRNGGNLIGPASAALSVTTNVNPLVGPPVTGAAPTSPQDLVRQIIALLTGDVRQYLLQMYTDTRVRDPFKRQVVNVPANLDRVLDLVMPLRDDLGKILRATSGDPALYRASLLVDRIGDPKNHYRSGDPLQKLSVLCELLEFGGVWNTG